MQQFGPQLGWPRVDTLKDSRHANMKELRFSAADGEWRVAFAFDTKRKAILLVAGDKSGGSEKRFYRGRIRKADDRFEAHLARLKKEKREVIMAVNVDDKIRKLSTAQRKKVEAQAGGGLITEEMTLRELRKARKLTQVRMAKRLGITQDGVSRLEKRSDLLLSTLRETVEAMGGNLSLVAEFPDRAPEARRQDESLLPPLHRGLLPSSSEIVDQHVGPGNIPVSAASTTRSGKSRV